MCAKVVLYKNSICKKENWLIEVKEFSGEFDDRAPNHPNRATIEIADFASNFSISYKDVSLYFDMGKIRDVDNLVSELVNSFEFASDR